MRKGLRLRWSFVVVPVILLVGFAVSSRLDIPVTPVVNGQDERPPAVAGSRANQIPDEVAVPPTRGCPSWQKATSADAAFSGPMIPPEQAVQAASRGRAGQQLQSVEIMRSATARIYVVRFADAEVGVDAITGSVVSCASD
jgi:hypothetical protein